MYLAQAVEYSVQIGRTRSISFEWLFPLTGFRASESGIDSRLFSIIAVSAALVLIATRPAVAVLGIQTTMVVRIPRTEMAGRVATSINAALMVTMLKIQQ